MTLMSELESKASGGAREYITFRVGTQYFCVDIMSVREIRGWTPATALPRAPGFVRGVINLRGIVLPVVDLSERLGFAPAEPTPRHVIIVAQTGRQIVGLLVDAVSDIIAMAADEVQPTPNVGSEAARAFVIGVMAIDDRMISLIALDSVMPGVRGEAA
jgi:purine-binding chemotaxis protein CheW